MLILYGRRTNPTVYFDSGYSLCVAVATLGETVESRGIGRAGWNWQPPTDEII